MALPLWSPSCPCGTLSGRQVCLLLDGHSSVPDRFRVAMHRAARHEAWHPQGPHRSTPPPRATTFYAAPCPALMPITPSSDGGAFPRDVVARGEIGGGWA